jgi:hypothetical protein
MNNRLRDPITRALPVACFALLSACGLAAAEPAGPAPKTHRLFMGSTLSVVSKDTTLPVRDVRDDAFVVVGPRGEVVIPAQDGEFRLKIDDTLKLTTEFATVERLSFERTYTPENDPMKKFADAARVSTYLGENNDAADAAIRQAQVAVGFNQAAVANSAGANGQIVAMAQSNLAIAQAQLNQAESASQRAQSMNNMDVFSTTTTSNRLTTEIAAETYDALRVTFSVASARPLKAPYLVIFMRFLEQKDRPDTANIWVYAEKLPDLDEHPRNVTILRGGFPPGYHIDSHHVHLYEGATEIATSVSRKQVTLTADEAFQYSVIQHITANRGQTRAPAKARFFWPDLSSRLLPEKLTRMVYVKVNKQGHALGIFEDEACQQPVADPDIAPLSSELRFFPALDQGKPVEGIAAVKLTVRG